MIKLGSDLINKTWIKFTANYTVALIVVTSALFYKSSLIYFCVNRLTASKKKLQLKSFISFYDFKC